MSKELSMSERTKAPDDEPDIVGGDYTVDGRPLAEARAEAERDIAEGRTVSNARVIAWLRTWGTEDETDPPECTPSDGPSRQ
jgi:hypothetical protein